MSDQTKTVQGVAGQWRQMRKKRRGYTMRNRLQFVPGGSAFFSVLKRLIDQAQESIHIQVYIFLDDKTGNEIGDALIDAARRNIEVYLLVDGYGSRKLSKSFIAKIKDAGISFRFFHKLFQSSKFYIGRRLHHKIFVVDGMKALVCGANVADRYNDLPHNRAWLDLAVFVEGESAKLLYQICDRMWARVGGKETKLPQNVDDSIAGVKEECLVRISRNDWLEKEMDIYETYIDLISRSKESITIICSYFLPGSTIRKLLKDASRRGVKIRVILTSSSDVMIFKCAARYLYRWMLRHKIELYEYQPTVLHAKVAVADGQFVTIGSYNINHISAHATIELNLDVDNKEFSATITKELERIIRNDCRKIDANNYHMGYLAPSHFPHLVCYCFIRAVIKISTFYSTFKE